MSWLAIPFMGMLISLVSVFIGLGGGIVMVPLLPDLFALTTKEAVATSLLTIALVVTDNTYRFNQRGLVRWPVVMRMGPISAVTAVIAAQIARRVDGRLILITLVVLLILVAIRTFLSSFMAKNYVAKEDLVSKDKNILVAGGALAGLTSGFAGVGSGVILSPIMIFLKVVKPIELSPTANANMMFTTIAASLSFLASGEMVSWNQWGLVRWDISVGVFVTASLISSRIRPYQNRLPFAAKSFILAALLVLLISKLLFRLNNGQL